MANQFLIKETMEAMRNLFPDEIDALKKEGYAGVKLLGYYEKGDTPAPIMYYLNRIDDPTLIDDGGSLIVVGDIKLKHQFVNEINLLYFGFKDGQDISITYSKALKIASSGQTLVIPACNTITTQPLALKSGVNIKGRGIKDTVIRTAQLSTHIFRSESITYKIKTTLSQDVMTGDNVLYISNTEGIVVGDFLLLKSNERFTREWDSGSVIREYYTDGELLKVLEVSPGRVITEGRCYLSFAQEGTTVQLFKPVGSKGSIEDLSLISEKDTDTYSNCLYVQGWEEFLINNVRTENANSCGIGLYTCYKTNLGYIETLGGTADLGLNYGIMVADGTKYTNIKNLIAKNHRHGLAGGGTGLAIPMYCDVESITVSESQSHSIDCHGNTAFFNVKNAFVDNFYSMSGIGHKMGTIISAGCTYAALGYEGGLNLSLDYGYIAAAGDFFVSKSFRNFKIGYLEINFGTIIREGYSFFTLPHASSGTIIDTLKLKNVGFDVSKTTSENKTYLLNSTRFSAILRGDVLINNLYLEGFQRGVQVVNSNIKINRFIGKNIGWSDINDTNGIPILNISGGAHNADVNNILIDNTALTEDYTSRTNIIFLSGGQTIETTNTKISNLRYLGNSVSNKIFKNQYFNDLKLNNIKLNNVLGVVDSTIKGYFIDNDFIADTVTKAVINTENYGAYINIPTDFNTIGPRDWGIYPTTGNNTPESVFGGGGTNGFWRVETRNEFHDGSKIQIAYPFRQPNSSAYIAFRTYNGITSTWSSWSKLISNTHLASITNKGVVNQSAASADVASEPSETYTQAEAQAILAELRDLKMKLRGAGILAT